MRPISRFLIFQNVDWWNSQESSYYSLVDINERLRWVGRTSSFSMIFDISFLVKYSTYKYRNYTKMMG